MSAMRRACSSTPPACISCVKSDQARASSRCESGLRVDEARVAVARRFFERLLVGRVKRIRRGDIAEAAVECVALGVDDRRRHRHQHGSMLVDRRDDTAHLAETIDLRHDDHAHGALGQRHEVDEHRRGRNVEASAVRVGRVEPVALLEQQARPVRVPGDVRAVGDDALRARERRAQRQVAADVVVDRGARVGAHVERGDDAPVSPCNSAGAGGAEPAPFQAPFSLSKSRPRTMHTSNRV